MAFSFFMKKKADPSRTQRKEQNIVENKPVIQVTDDSKQKPRVIVETPSDSKKPVYAFIDASNIFWGGKESLGFNIDYRKFLHFVEKKYGVSKTFYYGGIRTFDFEYSILDDKPLNLSQLQTHLNELQKSADDDTKRLIETSLNKLNFYLLLESYGYVMKIKPAKVYYGEDDENREKPLLKANCDVDLTFDLLRYMEQYSGAVVMTGDGDFSPVLSYLKHKGRSVSIISRWSRTANEIKTVAEKNFLDLEHIRNIIIYH